MVAAKVVEESCNVGFDDTIIVITPIVKNTSEDAKELFLSGSKNEKKIRTDKIPATTINTLKSQDRDLQNSPIYMHLPIFSNFRKPIKYMFSQVLSTNTPIILQHLTHLAVKFPSYFY